MVKACSHHHHVKVAATDRRHFAFDQHLTVGDIWYRNFFADHLTYIDHSGRAHRCHTTTLDLADHPPYQHRRSPSKRVAVSSKVISSS